MSTPQLLTPCTSRDELHAWIAAHLELSIPRQPVCAGHCSPLDYLWHAYHEPAGDAVVWAPRGGGKTTLGAVATLLDLLHKPGCAVRILGGSLEQSLRMWEHLEPMAQRVAGDEIVGKDRARRLTFRNGSTAAVLTQSQRGVRGLRVQKLRCDEVELFKPDIWAAVQLATRSRRSADVGGGVVGCAVEALSTLHQPAGLMQDILTQAAARRVPVFKWCLLDVLESCPPERSCDGCGLAEECGGKARRSEGGFFLIEDALLMKSRVSRAMWESEMLCLRPSTHLSVFAEFSDERHVAAEAPWAEDWRHRPPRTAYAIDFGYAHPFVCLRIAYDELGRVQILDEHSRSHLTVEKQLGEIRKKGWPMPHFVACDCAGNTENDQTSRTNIQLCRDEWKNVRDGKDRKISEGLERIRKELDPARGSPRLCIHPRCEVTIRSLRAYRYPGPGKEKPHKDGINDHAIDALRYFYTNLDRKGEARAY